MASTFRRRIDTDQDGFVLIEVLISGLIAVLVAGAVMTLFAATERSAADTRHRSQAAAVAQEDQARLRTMRIPTLYKFSPDPFGRRRRHDLHGRIDRPGTSTTRPAAT